MVITFIRHGKTAGNIRKQYIGSTDESLAPEGIAQLEQYQAAGVYPKEEDIDGSILVSPMKRCRETAATLFPGKRQTMVPGLREMDFGAFEGKSYEELKDLPAYRAWIDSQGIGPVPASEGQRKLGLRTLPGREEFEARCVESFLGLWGDVENLEGHCVFVVHGGTIMALMHGLGTLPEDYFTYSCENGFGIRCELVSVEGRPRLRLLEYLEI